MYIFANFDPPIFKLGFVVVILILSICLLSLILILGEVTNIDFAPHARKRIFEGMAVQKLYILYTNGQAISAVMTKDMKMKISQLFNLQYDPCSYFGIYDQPTINIFAASHSNVSYITRDTNKVKFIGDKMPHTPIMFEVNSCQLQVSNHFWIIGMYVGLVPSQNFQN